MAKCVHEDIYISRCLRLTKTPNSLMLKLNKSDYKTTKPNFEKGFRVYDTHKGLKALTGWELLHKMAKDLNIDYKILLNVYDAHIYDNYVFFDDKVSFELV